jgi:hypothetical protein
MSQAFHQDTLVRSGNYYWQSEQAGADRERTTSDVEIASESDHLLTISNACAKAGA